LRHRLRATGPFINQLKTTGLFNRAAFFILDRVMSFLKHRDFIAGSFFSLVGLTTALASSSYAMGTPMRMGPGYFPLLLGIVLLVLGIIIAVRSQILICKNDAKHHLQLPSLRPMLLVGGAMLLFAFSLNYAGLALSTLGLVALSGLAYRGFRWQELSILGGVLALFAVVVFVYGLGLPFHALPN
jgi:hypothetical protein